MKKSLLLSLMMVAAIVLSSCSTTEDLLEKNKPEDSELVLKKRVGGITKKGLTVSIPQTWTRMADDSQGSTLVSYSSKKEKSYFKVTRTETKGLSEPDEVLPKGFTYIQEDGIGGRPGMVFKSKKDLGFIAIVQVQDQGSSKGSFTYRFEYLAKKPVKTMSDTVKEIFTSVHWVTDAEFQKQYIREKQPLNPIPEPPKEDD